MSIHVMKYSAYKQHYNDCETVRGSYDKNTKTIEVIIPDGRMKASGVRGERFFTYELWFIKNGKKYYTTYKAVCLDNAIKQHIKACRKSGYIPLDENGAEI